MHYDIIFRPLNTSHSPVRSVSNRIDNASRTTSHTTAAASTTTYNIKPTQKKNAASVRHF